MTVIAAASVPPSPQAAVKAKYPKAVIQGAERITRGSEVEYELTLKNAPKKAIVLAANGRILKEG